MNTTTTSTTTLCPEHGIVNPEKAKIHTVTTEDYPEAGPFETRSEAMRAFVPPLGNTVLSVEHREDGWYRTYIASSTTSIYYNYEQGRPWWHWWRRRRT